MSDSAGLPGRGRILVAVLSLTVAVLLAFGITHSVRSARLRSVPSVDPSGIPGVGEPGFAATVAAIAEAALVGGNVVEVLVNGDRTFGPLLADLRGASRSITMQMYYGQPGAIADSVLRILTDRARAGITVYFMYDALGSDRLPESYRAALAGAGVRVAVFQPLRWERIDRLGWRAHTRVAVIDGRVGYTGGFGLDDKWLGDARRPGEWRETNVRFTGPAVRQLQAAFVEEWAEATGQLLAGSDLFPASVGAGGSHTAGLVHSLPGAGPSPAERALALSIAAARRTLYISNAYFLPNRHFRELLVGAARRGVEVQVLTNGPETDNGLTLYAGRGHYEELLAAGIRIHEYRPTMMHAKTLVADGAWSSIGSMNFDNRSLALNSETSLLVLDQGIGATMDSLFRADLLAAEEITLEEFRRRSWVQRLLERGAGLLDPVL